MKQFSISLLFLGGFFIQSHGQLTVADDNNVGIGVTEPVSELSINGEGNTESTLFVENSTATSSQRVAHFFKSASGDTGGDYSFSVYGQITHSGGYKLIGGVFTAHHSTIQSNNYRTFGVKGIAGNGISGFNYGVYGHLVGSSNGAAILGTINGAEVNVQGRYAGYFLEDVKILGDLYVDGICTGSDINLKKEIRPLSNEESKQLAKLKTLTAIKYKYKTPTELNLISPEVADTMKVDPLTMEYTSDKYTKDHIGFSAQEVQLVYPELVKESQDGYLSMNYLGLIPVLVEAIKEQDAAIQLLDEAILTQAAAIELLRQEIEKLKNPETSK